MQDHHQVELILQRLCALLDHADFNQEMRLAREFIDHAEYGLALLTLVEIMTTYDRRPSPMEYDLIQRAAQEMELPTAGDEETAGRFEWLSQNVTPAS